jgi:hypothetical protein
MTKDQQLFYGSWAGLWLLLAFCTKLLLHSWAETGFVTFPIAWTVAILITRYQTQLRDFARHSLMKYMYLIGILSCQAWSSWDRGVHKESPVFKTIGVMEAIAVVLIFITLVNEVIKACRRNNPSSTP